MSIGKTSPKQKPKPSKEVLEMVKAIRAKKAGYRKHQDLNEESSQMVKATDAKQPPSIVTSRGQ